MAGQLGRLSGLIVAVLAGCFYMAVAGAPHLYLIINGAALACAMALAVFLKRPDRSFGAASFTGTASALFVVTLFSGVEIDGVHRWIAVGPVRLHVGLLLLPATVSLLPALRKEWALLTVVSFALIVALQPDRASAFALFAGVLALAIAKRERWSMGMLAIAATAFLWSLWQPDPLQPVVFVEHMIRDAWKFHPVSAALLAGSLVLALVAPLVGTDVRSQMPLIVSLATVSGSIILSFFGPYPTPLIGYGASAIIGYGLALGLSAVRKQGSDLHGLETS